MKYYGEYGERALESRVFHLANVGTLSQLDFGYGKYYCHSLNTRGLRLKMRICVFFLLPSSDLTFKHSKL